MNELDYWGGVSRRLYRPLPFGHLLTRVQVEVKRAAYAQQIGVNGLFLLESIDHDAMPRWWRESPTVELLRQTWLHQSDTDAKGQRRLRQAKDLPPAGK